MEHLLSDLKIYQQSETFRSQLESLEADISLKLDLAFELASAGLILCMAKQASLSFGQAIIAKGVLHAEVREDFLNLPITPTIFDEMNHKGDLLIGSLLPSQKSSIVRTVSSQAKVRSATASVMVNVLTYLLVARIKKEAHNRKWDQQELPYFLYQMRTIPGLLTYLSAKDIEVLGITKLFSKVR